MFLFIPTGSSEDSGRRAVVTMSLALACIAAFAFTTFVDPPQTGRWLQEVDATSELDLSDEARTQLMISRFEQLGGAQRRWSLVPARGPAQVGWLTSMFVHFDLWHLLGNLLFLWLVGPLLEEAWGRARFLIFYLLAGLVAGLVQYVLIRHGMQSIGGASGAIAGCMGAFTFRFATTKVRFHYFAWFFRIFTGNFWLPAWLCGAAWFGREVMQAMGGGEEGVATGAHIGGFVLGGLVALGMKALGIEHEFKTVAESSSDVRQRQDLMADALSAMARDELAQAQDALTALQKLDPAYPRLSLVAGELDVRMGRGQVRLEKGLRAAMKDSSSREVENTLTKLWAMIDPRGFSPGFAWELAQRLQRARPAVDAAMVQSLLTAEAEGSGVASMKAREALTPKEKPKVQAPKVLDAGLVSVGEEGLRINVAGNVNEVPFKTIGAVHPGLVATLEVKELYVEVLIKNEPPVAFRLRGSDPQLPKLFPDKSVLSGWETVLLAIERGARIDVRTSGWATYDSVEALTATWAENAG